MDHRSYLKDYAHLLVEFGAGLQPGQILLLEIDAENYELAQYITEAAFAAEAKDVVVVYSDEAIDAMRARNDVPFCEERWKLEALREALGTNAVSIAFLSPRPSLSNLLATEQAESLITYKNGLRNVVRDAIFHKNINWLYACVPNRDWAQFLFPELPQEAAYEKLWDVLMHICRIGTGEDAASSWIDFYDENYKKAAWLKKLRLSQLHITSELGTDITVGLFDGAQWLGGVAKASRTVSTCQCNIPSYEIGTTPRRLAVNGVVYAALPLYLSGQRIDKFWFRFEQGRVTDFGAEEGYDVLKAFLSREENRYLGEVAFVEITTPIHQVGIVFGNTLLDENAACHMALGRGVTDVVPGLVGKTDEEVMAAGVNLSAFHVDFMFGTPGTNADGITQDGTVVPVFRSGMFVQEE